MAVLFVSYILYYALCRKIYMTHETYELRKYGIDKIALFGLLVLAVLAAWLLII